MASALVEAEGIDCSDPDEVKTAPSLVAQSKHLCAQCQISVDFVSAFTTIMVIRFRGPQIIVGVCPLQMIS